MVILKAYKTKLILNNAEREYLRQCAGAARYVYNWGLNALEQYYQENGKSTSARTVKKSFNAQKEVLCPWITQYPYTILESEFDFLQRAFDNYWRKRKAGGVARDIARLKERGQWNRRVAKMLDRGRSGIQLEPGYPKFKSRHDRKSFSLRGSIVVHEGKVRLPSPRDKTVTRKLRVGPWFRLAEDSYLPLGVEILSVSVSEEGNDWYISFQVRENVPDPHPTTEDVLGVDFGVKAVATVSDGTVFDNNRPLANYEDKLKRLQRKLARQNRGGANYKKTQEKIADLHQKIARIRRHNQHNISRELTINRRPKAVCIEDLNVKGMLASPAPNLGEDGITYKRNNRRAKAGLAKSISDVGIGELVRQLEYKAQWNGIEVVKAYRFYPSSKTCSACGSVKDVLSLDVRTFICENCGLIIDRDLNAAKNLASLYRNP